MLTDQITPDELQIHMKRNSNAMRRAVIATVLKFYPENTSYADIEVVLEHTLDLLQKNWLNYMFYGDQINE